jgi:hypothetical protein
MPVVAFAVLLGGSQKKNSLIYFSVPKWKCIEKPTLLKNAMDVSLNAIAEGVWQWHTGLREIGEKQTLNVGDNLWRWF